MTDRDIDKPPQKRQPTLQRRQVLAATAGLTGLAGCIGGGGDAGGEGDTDGGGAGTVACSDLTDGYESYDSGEIAFVFDMELPAALIDSAEYDIVAGIFELRAERDWVNGDIVNLVAQQNPNARTEVRFESASDFMQDVEQSSTVSFNGEERPVWATETTKAGGASRTVELPYDVEGDTLYFKADIIVDTGMSESTEECVSAFDEAIDHVVMSLTPNEDSTIASEMNPPG